MIHQNQYSCYKPYKCKINDYSRQGPMDGRGSANKAITIYFNYVVKSLK